MCPFKEHVHPRHHLPILRMLDGPAVQVAFHTRAYLLSNRELRLYQQLFHDIGVALHASPLSHFHCSVLQGSRDVPESHAHVLVTTLAGCFGFRHTDRAVLSSPSDILPESARVGNIPTL